MTPYYQDDAVTIYHGDCREIVPTLGPIRAVVCDPPYCSGGFNEAGKRAAKGMGFRIETIREIGWFVNDNMTTTGLQWLMGHLAGWCQRILVDGGTFTAFTDWRMVPALVPSIESSGMRYQSLIVWKKPSSGLGSGFRAQHELAMHFSNGTPEYFATNGTNVIDSARVNAADRLHQTEKPVELMAEIIRVVSKSGDIILDPFAGSGTTGRAAKDLGRKAVLIEREERYCEIAAKRMAQEVLSL